jgi:hypothetical protein
VAFFVCLPEDKNRVKHSDPPSDIGVNLLVPGAILSFPTHVRDGLLDVGDGHATRGDGARPGPATENFLVTIGNARQPENASRIACREPSISGKYLVS